MGASCSRVPTLPKRILLIGQSGAGKTQLLYTWILKSVDFEPTPTIGFNVEEVTSNSGQSYVLWDLGGADSFKLRHRQFFHGSDAVVFMVDSTQTAEIDIIKSELLKLLKERDLKGLPFLILVNKADISGSHSMSEEEWQEALGLSSLTDCQYKLMVTSALNITDSMKALDALDSLLTS